MATPSVSFRISRNAEDLASTIHALSQRLVKLEQRLVALEHHLTSEPEVSEEELISLDNVERLLRDCRDLLDVAEDTAEQPIAAPVAAPVTAGQATQLQDSEDDDLDLANAA
jgi:hypothetical protein